MTEPPRTKPLHPARRRLIIAVVIWALVIRTLIYIVTDTLEVADVWSEVVSTALFLAIFIPLSLAAVQELNDFRKRGLEPLPQIPTRRSLIALGVFTVLFWTFFIWFIQWRGDFVFPLLPILCIIALGVNIRRYYLAGQPLDDDAQPQSD
ncbi:hypothetical protein [Arthrobacter agilis]|uniref:hypothetical protein n=1 Tax=Arthrobacter agilis TaxID=37921 RepID=UPI001ABFC5B9|nr:hypothetical protein [Arthrobacter agilis]